jgi:hypothetical protein
VAAFALTSSAQAAFPGANGLLAFNSDRYGDFELFTMRADGSNQTQRTGNRSGHQTGRGLRSIRRCQCEERTETPACLPIR